MWGKRQVWVTGRHRGDRQEQADMGDRQTWGGQARGQAGTEGTGRGQADMGPGRQGNTRGCWRRHLGQQSPEGMGTTAVAVLPSVTPEEGPCHQPPWGGASGAPLPGPSGSLCPPWGCHPPTLGCSRTTAARGVTTATAPVRPPGSGSTGRRGSGGGGGGETCGGAGPHLAPPPCPIGCPLPSLSRAPIKGVAERGAPHTGSGGGSGTDMSEVRARCRVAHSNGVFLFPFIFSNGPGENQSREWRGWGGGVFAGRARDPGGCGGSPTKRSLSPPFPMRVCCWGPRVTPGHPFSFCSAAPMSPPLRQRPPTGRRKVRTPGTGGVHPVGCPITGVTSVPCPPGTPALPCCLGPCWLAPVPRASRICVPIMAGAGGGDTWIDLGTCSVLPLGGG